MGHSRVSYATAGVDTHQVSVAHKILAKKLETTFRTRRGKFGEPVFPIGHYAGIIDIGNGQVLSLHTDSVGTKIIIARLMHRYDTIGIDCVAMCANDLVCTGSEPVAFLDYLAVSKPNPSLTAEIAEGLVNGARQSGMAIVGGETAVVPDLLSTGSGGGIDLVGMAVGVCSKDKLVLGNKIQNGEAIVGVTSSGIHSNGLTLARKVLLKRHSLREKLPELGRSIGEELLKPTRIYVKPTIEALKKTQIHGLAHITGSGFSKLNRIVSQVGLGATLDNFPPLPGIFRLIQKEARIDDLEMYRIFNMGIGLVAICPGRSADAVIRIFKKHRQKASILGEVTRRKGIWVNGKRL